MRLLFLATGNEKDMIPGCQRASFALETEGGLYLFDAGACCALTAYRNGLDLTDIRAIFVAHPGMIHLAGLPNLLWSMRMLSASQGRKADRDIVHLFMPYIRPWRGMLDMLESSMKNSLVHNYILEVSELDNGIVFENADLRVRARTTRRFSNAMVGMNWRAYSFAIEAGGRTLAYTGHVEKVGMLADLLAGCDILLVETVEQEIDSFRADLEAAGIAPSRIVFFHGDQPPLAGAPLESALARLAAGGEAEILVAREGMALDL